MRELATRIAAFGDLPKETDLEEHAIADALQTVVETEEERDQRRTHEGAPYSYLVLSVARANGQVVVGALALAPGLTPLEPVERSFLEEVARGIYDAGDVHTVYFQAKDTAPA
jgi:hypothetical protein